MGFDLKKLTLSNVVEIPYKIALDNITRFTKNFVENSGAARVVMGLSGGVDSSVLLAVLVEALGSNRVVALIMPDTRATPPEDTEDAVELARRFDVEYYVVYIDKIVDSYKIAPFVTISEDIVTGNLRARIRSNLIYYYANKHRAVVAGSSDRSELLIGYFTKYGDGAADFLPLGCLYKTQVRRLGLELGLPEKIVEKPSAPRLYYGHTARDEIGYTYEEIDLALYAIFDCGMNVEEAVEATGIPREVFEKLLRMHRMSRHKRTIPAIPVLPWLPQPVPEV